MQIDGGKDSSKRGDNVNKGLEKCSGEEIVVESGRRDQMGRLDAILWRRVHAGPGIRV